MSSFLGEDHGYPQMRVGSPESHGAREYECPNCRGEVHVGTTRAFGTGDTDYAACLECDWQWSEGEGTEFPFANPPGGGS